MHSSLAGDWLFLGRACAQTRRTRREEAKESAPKTRRRVERRRERGRERERVGRTDFSGIQLLRTLDSRNRSVRGEK